MTKTTIPFTFSHLKPPKKRYYMTRFVVIVKRCVFGLRLGSVHVTPIPEVTEFHFRSSLKYHKWTCYHPQPPKQCKNHQILLNIGGVRAKVSSGPPPVQKDPPQGVQGSKNLAPSIFTYYDLKPTRICNKINFDKQIRRETFFVTNRTTLVVESHRYAVDVSMLSVIFPEIYVCVSSCRGHIDISVCRSLS